MSKRAKNRHPDNPNALTADDKAVLKKKTITPTDVKDALKEDKTDTALISGTHVPEIVPRLILGVLLVISGIFVVVLTSISIIGILFGAAMIIGGILVPFTSIGAGAGRRDTV